MDKLRWGVHTSTEGPVLSSTFVQLAKTDMRCIQIFFGNPKSLSRKKLTEDEEVKCKKLISDHNISFNTHFPYTFNMCDPDLNMGPLQAEIDRVSRLGGRVILHTGSCTAACCANRDLPKVAPATKTTWEKDWTKGADVLISHLNKLKFSDEVDYPLLLEPPAGEGRKLGWHIDQLAYIFARCPKQVGFCLDTCHAFAAGLCRFRNDDDIAELFRKLEVALVDKHRFRLIHLNDSKDAYLSMKDNHETLTKGNIWSDPNHIEGLMSLFLWSSEWGVDIVSEVGEQNDIDVMRQIVKDLKEASE